MRTLFTRSEPLLLGCAAVLLLVAVWWGAVQWTATSIFPSPRAVLLAADELVEKGLLWGYLLDSLLRVGSGYGLALLLGIPAGLLLGWFPAAAMIFNPLIQMMRPISPLAWIPIAIILFGVSNAAPIFLVFLGAFFPIVVATMSGVGAVPRMYMRAGHNFGLTTAQLMLKVVLPAALPRILSGLRIALGIAWLVVVAAEMIAVDSGLGYLIIDSRNAGKRYDLVIAGMVSIGLVGLALDIMIARAQRVRFVRWGFRSDPA